MRVQNVIQALGAKVCEEVKEQTEAHKAGKVQGSKEVPILFEETDGIYTNLQGKDRKRNGQDMAEIKVGISYDGWKKIKKDHQKLQNKVVVAGFAKAKKFQEYREAAIIKKFNLEEMSQRITGISEHGNHEESCVKRDSQKEETQLYQLEQTWRKSSGKNISKEMQREIVRGNRAFKS